MRFSSRYIKAKGEQEIVFEDAPKKTRIGYYSNVLEPYFNLVDKVSLNLLIAMKFMNSFVSLFVMRICRGTMKIKMVAHHSIAIY